MQSYTAFQHVFLYCAIIGGSLFIIRLIFMFMGLGDHDSADVGDHDIDHADVDHEHSSSDLAFKLLSFQGMMAFLLTFGLFGLAASRDSKLPNGLSAVIALAAGFASVWLTNKMFKFFGKLQHSGNVNMANAIGQIGTVYLSIAPKNPGKVTVAVQGRLMTLDAVASDEEEFKTGTQVEVKAILFGKTLLVRAVNAQEKAHGA